MELDLEPIFSPSSVAIVGASPKREKVGNVILENFLRRFRGKIYPVNPKYDNIYGLKCYKKVSDIPEDVDLVVIAIPARFVPDVLEDAAKKGVKGAIIISSGFSEVGEEGRKLENKLREIREKYGIRIIGPNGMGIYDPYSGVDTFFVYDDRVRRPPKGNIAIISQSGATALALMEWLSERGIGVSKIISFGNKVDVDEVDLLEEFMADPTVDAVFIYLEGLKEGRGYKFVKLSKEFTKTKTIVVLKAGKSKKGQEAVASHTASMAGDYEVYKFALKQAGIIEAETIDDFLKYLQVFSYFGKRRVKKLLIYTNGGGFGVLSTDYASREGFDLPPLSPALRSVIEEILPDFASIKNPLDTTASAPEDSYLKGLKRVLEFQEYDAILSILLPQLPSYTEDFPRKFAEIYDGKTPIVFVIYGGEFSRKIKEELSKIVPVFDTPEEAIRALKILKVR